LFTLLIRDEGEHQEPSGPCLGYCKKALKICEDYKVSCCLSIETL
jgi:hypothetical protein